MRFEAGGHHGLSLHRLLIEAGTHTAALIKTVGADRHKMAAVRLVSLKISQPGERLERGVAHGAARYRLTAHQKSVGQRGIAITQTFFKPAPFFRAIRLDTT